MAKYEDCGTNTAYQRHYRSGEKPCEECIEGKAIYDRDRRSEPHNREKIKRRIKAQGEAVTHLTRKYRPEYVTLYQTTPGDAGKRQRFARQQLVEKYREEYQELYRKRLKKANAESIQAREAV